MSKAKVVSSRKSHLSDTPEPGAAAPESAGQIIKRPGGYYWIASGGQPEFGPFASYDEAWADMEQSDDQAPEPGESLQEAESELGIADWIDPETGDPAEGLSRPHLDSD